MCVEVPARDSFITARRTPNDLLRYRRCSSTNQSIDRGPIDDCGSHPLFRPNVTIPSTVAPGLYRAPRQQVHRRPRHRNAWADRQTLLNDGQCRASLPRSEPALKVSGRGSGKRFSPTTRCRKGFQETRTCRPEEAFDAEYADAGFYQGRVKAASARLRAPPSHVISLAKATGAARPHPAMRRSRVDRGRGRWSEPLEA